ncbi:MAG: DUF3341 domain-containing protein [Bacteroidota bacterium]|nr:DUF3341 domain-containing protein [Bacteroidota bacterium]
MEKIEIIGVYDDPDVLVSAIHKIRDKGIKIKNVFSPFPVHGVFEALNLKTRLPYLTFIYGVIGVSVSFAFLYWTSVVSYPLKFGGKPLNSLSFIIIMFIATIFVATLLTFMTFFIRQKLGPGKKVVMIDPRTTDDKFAIIIEKDPELSADDISQINKVLEETGAVEIAEKPLPEGYIEEEND